MNIVFICNHFLPRIGGVELSVHHTARALARAGHVVTVVTETPETPASVPGEAYSVIRFSVPIVRPVTRLFYWREMWKLRRVFRAADLLHFHDYTPFIHWYLPLAFAIRTPVYGITFHGFEGFPIRRIHRILRALCTPFMDIVFGVGDYLKKYYPHRFDAFYVGAPINAPSGIPDIPEYDFFFAGRLEPDTGILECIAAIASTAHKTERRIDIRIAGEGTLRSELESMQNSFCRIEFAGSLPNPALEYPKSKFVIATGFLAIFDAFASEVPVVIPAFSAIKQDYVQSIPEIEKKAFVIYSITEMEALVMTLLDDSERIEEKVRNASVYAGSLSWDNIASMYIDAYNAAVAKRR